MTNILFLYNRKIATVELMYEVFCGKEATARGLNCVFAKGKDVTRQLLREMDAVVCIRSQDLREQLLLEEIHRSGIFCVQFYDDDINAIPDEKKRYVQRLPWRRQAIRNGFRNTDMILSSNKLLAMCYAKLIPSGRYATLETPVEMGLKKIDYNDEKEGIIKIIYAASEHHKEDFDRYITPVFPQLIKRYGKRIAFSFICVKPDVIEYQNQIDINFIEAMPLEQYREYIKREHFQIGLAPLEGNDFTKFKYYNKYIEYTLSGLVGIYSNTEPYNLIVQDRYNGFLAQNKTDAWFDTICQVIDDHMLRKTCFENAYQLLEDNFNQSAIWQRLLEDIPEFGDNKRKKTNRINLVKVNIKYTFLRMIEVIWTMVHYLREKGIGGTFMKSRNYLIDKIAGDRERI